MNKANEMKKRFLIPACVMAAAAVCFGIVSYGHFYRGRIGLGCVFAALTLAQLALAVMNCILSKKKDQSESVSGDIR